jgi:hypothetical protein
MYMHMCACTLSAYDQIFTYVCIHKHTDTDIYAYMTCACVYKHIYVHMLHTCVHMLHHMCAYVLVLYCLYTSMHALVY